MIKLMESYKKRSIRFLEIYEINEWKLKTYGISYDKEFPSVELVSAAKKIAFQLLPKVSESVYGFGFLGIHEGRGVDFVFVDWWQDENELHHHVFISPIGKPELLEEKTHTGVSACVWDLKVICFEREVWLEKVLKNEKGPDIEGYLECRLNEDV